MRYGIMLLVALSLGCITEAIAKGYDGAYATGGGRVGQSYTAPEEGDAWQEGRSIVGVAAIEVGLLSGDQETQNKAKSALDSMLTEIKHGGCVE